jgi:hypothetical protein
MSTATPPVSVSGGNEGLSELKFRFRRTEYLLMINEPANLRGLYWGTLVLEDGRRLHLGKSRDKHRETAALLRFEDDRETVILCHYVAPCLAIPRLGIANGSMATERPEKLGRGSLSVGIILLALSDRPFLPSTKYSSSDGPEMNHVLPKRHASINSSVNCMVIAKGVEGIQSMRGQPVHALPHET